MIIDIAITAIVILGLLILAYGIFDLARSAYLSIRNRNDAAPLHAALQRMGENVKARNARVSAKNIEDTFG